MRKLSLVPVWLLNSLLEPFLPKRHKWHGKHCSLQEWHDTATEFSVQISIGLWVSGLCLFYATIFSFILAHARAAH